jgi:hypothetical protein
MTDRQIAQSWPGTAEALAGAIWRKSSYSGTQGNCVEVATFLLGEVRVRDSKDVGCLVLRFVPDEWRLFVWSVRASGSPSSVA